MSADKGKVMVLGEEEGSTCEVIVDEWQLEKISEFKYFGLC